MKALRRAGVILVALGAALSIGAVAVGARQAMRSSLFLVQVVEVDTDAEGEQAVAPPVEPQEISDLAAVPVGQANLFDLDLKAIETRILANSWIRSVRLEKHFPQTLSISAKFRRPRAILQSSATLSYVDEEGTVFGKVSLAVQPDLPILHFPELNPEPQRVLSALRLLGKWEKPPLGALAQLSSLSWDAERGYRALVVYRMKPRKTGASPAPASQTAMLSRAIVDFGEIGEKSQGSDAELEPQLARLTEVFRYLHENSISARQIWADAGKKIVVKTARGS
jgi:hypothetical protein